MKTALAWLAVSVIQLYATGYAFRCGQEDERNGGGNGYAWLSVIFGVTALVCAQMLGGAA